MQRFTLSALNRHVQASQGFRPSQHGFTKGRSCLTNLISFYDQEPLHGGGAGGTLFAVNSQLSRSRACKVAQEGHRSCKDGLRPCLPCSRCPCLPVETSDEHVRLHHDSLFFRQKMALQKKRFLEVVLLLPLALAGVYCGTSLPVWTTRAKGLIEELTCASAAQLKILRSSRALLAEQTQKMQLLLQEVAQLTAEIRSGKKEVWEVNQAVSDMASEVYVKTSDWALKSSGATIDMQRTSETYDCKKEWICRVLWFFRTANPPDTILQPDVSPGNCWPLQGHQGQVVIRLPARVHLTAVSVQHISKDVSPSGTVISAPRDVAVFGLDADGEEEALLGTFMYNVAKEAIQTFPLKNAPLPRAFSYIKLLVKSNWGNPAYTCIYRVQVHGKMAKPESVD
ncbi:sperm-associated antigen 4 protein-like isoform X2 [Mycteria americana]|uniref:sperm-associated antigen 4 protein-like isoform X2 n=1 Tax=Mycteria americana TaxID=33587 RepID=UPI003F58CB19